MNLKTRKYEELDALQKLALIPLSHSRLETVMDGGFSCKAKCFYQYILKIPTKSGPAAVLGNVIHDVLEDMLEPNEPVTLGQEDAYMEHYKVKLEEWDPGNAIPMDLRNAGTAMIKEFLDRHDGDSWPIHAKEMQFQIVLGNALMRGFIDRVDVEDDIVHIVDYKSGKAEAPQKNI